MVMLLVRSLQGLSSVRARLALTFIAALLPACPLMAAALPGYVVTTAADATDGTAANCTDQSLPGAIRDSACSLRDALAAAAVKAGGITFDSKVFAASQPTSVRTITLVNGTLNVPSNTSVTGPVSGSGPSAPPLVTLVPDTAGDTAFTIASGVVSASVSALILAGSESVTTYGLGGGFYNDGELTLTNITVKGINILSAGGGIENDTAGNLTLSYCSISGNNPTMQSAYGVGIDNHGVLAMSNCTVSNNLTKGENGAGIENWSGGTLTITDSTISGNAIYGSGYGGGIYNNGTLTTTSSTISGNSAPYSGNGSGMYNIGTLTLTNTILADNATNNGEPNSLSSPPVEDDCAGSGCPANGANGNAVGSGRSSLSPGSAAICAGLIADIPAGLTTDQRGAPRTTTYTASSGNVTCLDSGALQMHYALGFTTQPPASVAVNTNFSAAVQVSESGNPAAVGNVSIPMALSAGDNGALNVSSLETDPSGLASSNQLQVSAAGSSDTLAAMLTVTATPPPPPLTAPISISAASTSFDVTGSTVQVTVGTLPTGLTFSVDGTSYSAQTTFSWTSGSQHTLATTSPQGNSCDQYAFNAWTDAGAISHTVTASTSRTTYSADFTQTAASSSACLLTTPSSPAMNFVVNTASDDATGVPSNCTTAGATCTLRDALAAASSSGSGTITFSTTVFAASQSTAARTITLTAGTLNVPSNTSVNGPTTGSGRTLTNLVTVSGNGQSTVFTVNSGVTGAAISGLIITGGSTSNEGGGIFNSGVLTVSGSTISGNNASALDFTSGGGIENSGVMTLTNSSVTGNGAGTANSGCTPGCGVSGGGIDNPGTLTIISSTVAGNNVSVNVQSGGSTTGETAAGGGIANEGTLTIMSSTVAGNTASSSLTGAQPGNPNVSVSASGGGISGSVTTGTNNIISGNTTNGSEDDCDGSGCPVNGTNGNVIGSNAQLAPLGNYGGPTQTTPPFPGNSAICGGVVADIPAGVTTDQRGLPRTITYGSNPPCVDSGAVQTNYSVSFSTEPPATVAVSADFTAALQVSESGSPFAVAGIGIPIGLGAGENGILNVSTLSTNASGIAGSSQLTVSAAGNPDTLVATLPLTTAPPPAPLTSPISASATSTSFAVAGAGIQVTVGTSPAGPAFSVDGTPYNGLATLTWTAGSQHTIATTSPQSTTGAQYTFASWSDGGAISHTVTASTAVTSYTATFAVAYQLILSASPSQGGTVSPASGTYYTAGTVVNLTATPSAGYAFTGWTGAVAASSSASTTITMSAPETVVANFGVPSYVVTVNTDTTTGVAANCTNQNLSGATPDKNCSLRDALAAAAASGAGSVTFNATVFAASQSAAARTIVLGSAGTLNVPANTSVLGPTTGTGTTLKQLVTVSGNNQNTVFSTGGTNTVLSGLMITDGNGGGIYNSGTLAVSDSTIFGNTSPSGGGISNSGTLTVSDSTISGNTVSVNGSGGGGIFNSYAAANVINSTISGNTDPNGGGGIYNVDGNVVLTGSTISGNSGGIFNTGQQGQFSDSPPTLTVTNSIVAGNTSASFGDCDDNTIFDSNGNPVTAVGCPTNGVSGNVTGVIPLLAPLSNYGGPTQTQPPLPGSPAICGGVVADIPAGVTTDQRGFPRTITYGSNPLCVDSGAVQTNYSVSFSAQPPATISPNADFSAAVQLSESGSPFAVAGIAIPIALGAGDNGVLNVSSLSTNASGIAGSSQLTVSAAGNPDTLVAALPLTTAPPPAPLTSPISASATSSSFAVGGVGIQVTVGTSPAGLAFSVDGTSYTAQVTLTWTAGSQHTLATTQQGSNACYDYTWANWSDGGAISHTVTASTTSISYTANFQTTAAPSSECLLTVSSIPAQGGTVSPGTGNYPFDTLVNLTATPNSGYGFANWTGVVNSPYSASTSVLINGPEAVTANFFLIPASKAFIVNTSSDDATGVPSNCTTAGGACTLRDALLAAAASGSGTITFDPTVFAASQPVSARTITLTGGTLIVPTNTTITGPTTGNGASLTQLVTVNGNALYTVFTVNTGAVNTAISGLVITNGSDDSFSNGGGIGNQGALTVTNSMITGNIVYLTFGGGIYNGGTLTLKNSTLSQNKSVDLTEGVVILGNGGLFNGLNATATVIDSTISGNETDPDSSGGSGITNAEGATLTLINTIVSGNAIVPGNPVSSAPQGGGISNDGTLMLYDSTVVGNTNAIGSNGGIDNGGTLVVKNSMVGGNSGDDCDGTGCPVNGTNGNVVGNEASVAPGAPGVCAGLIADIPTGITTDQRGEPRTTVYTTSSGNVTCVDAGAIQTNYSLAFSTQPPATIPVATNFSAGVQLSESGSPFVITGFAIPIALGAGDNGTLNTASLTTGANGIASSGTLQVSAGGSNDTVVATLPITTTPPPASLTSPISLSVTSNSFDVTESSQTITFPALPASVTFGVAPITLKATASSGLAVSYSVTGPATVSGSTLTITGAGTVVVTASQAGNGGSFTAATPVSQTITVTQAASTTTVTTSAASVNLNAPVTFTATVTSKTAATPTGSVQFLDGTAVLGTVALTAQGSAAYTTGSLTAGSHTINAVYSGNTNFTESMGMVAETVTAPSFILTAAPTSLTLKQGQTGQITITLTPTGGYSGSLTLTCSGAPLNATCTPTPKMLTADGSNTPVTSVLSIVTEGSNTGTVTLLQPGPPTTDGGLLRYALLPAGIFGWLIFRQRKRLSPAAKRALWMAVFLCAIAGINACGAPPPKPPSSPTTPVGSSTITVTAAASGGTPQSITVTVMVTK
jgi:CSLREA domain-containing protein